MMKESRPEFQKSVLDNGLRIVSSTMPQTRSVSVCLYLGAGSRYEAREESGLSHFLEHMVFKGTERRPTAKAVSEAIEGVGGILNGGTDRELTTYWAKVARPHFSLALDLLSDLILGARIDPQDMEKERPVILSELSMLLDSPQQRVDLLVDELLWPGQPLGRDVVGNEESVKGLGRQSFLDYRSQQYRPNNAVVAVSGDIGHAEVVEAVAGSLGAWAPGPPRAWTPAQDEQETPRFGLITRKTEQAHFCLAYKGLSATHPDRYALGLLMTILGEGMSSRLFQEIREKRGLAYEVASYGSHLQDSGSLIVYAGVDPRRVKEAVAAVKEELLRMAREEVPEDELRRTKEFSKGRLFLRMEDSRAQAGWAGAQELLLGRVRSIDEVVATIEAITPGDILRVAQSLLVPQRLSLAVVGPFRSHRPFQKLLG